LYPEIVIIWVHFETITVGEKSTSPSFSDFNLVEELAQYIWLAAELRANILGNGFDRNDVTGKHRCVFYEDVKLSVEKILTLYGAIQH
jgi:hypothetical protein